MSQNRLPTRTVTLQETDQQMLAWLREQFTKFKEGGYGRHYSDAVVARFAELIDNQTSIKRAMGSIEDAQKLAMAQVQFAQSVVKQLEKQLRAISESEHRSNGNALTAAESAVDLKGE